MEAYDPGGRLMVAVEDPNSCVTHPVEAECVLPNRQNSVAVNFMHFFVLIRDDVHGLASCSILYTQAFGSVARSPPVDSRNTCRRSFAISAALVCFFVHDIAKMFPDAVHENLPQ
jgi:hypothetical protein